MSSLLPSPFNSIYAASNKYQEKLIETLQFEYCNKNIQFQCLNSGFYQTSSNEPLCNEKGLKIASFAIKTLGWSKYTYGYWLIALRVNLYHIIYQRNFTPNLRFFLVCNIESGTTLAIKFILFQNSKTKISKSCQKLIFKE